MSLVKCWYHYFLDRQACNNYAAYLFLAHIGSILTTSRFQAGCHPPRENPYLQYFIGLSSYSNNIPFDASLLVHFMQRISVNLARQSEQKDGEKIREASTTRIGIKQKRTRRTKREAKSRKIIIRCDLCQCGHYLSNRHRNSRSHKNETEKIVDILYESIKDLCHKKPRTYRKKARKDYLAIAFAAPTDAEQKKNSH